MPDLAHIILAFVCIAIASGFTYCICVANKVSEPEPIEPLTPEVTWPSGTVSQRPYNHEHRTGVPVEEI